MRESVTRKFRNAAIIAIALMLRSVSPVYAQDTQFAGYYGDVSCPPSFPSFYLDRGFHFYTFWGKSTLSMRNSDGSVAYSFHGKTNDGLWEVTGTHYVASNQCGWAYYSYFFQVPATIARLWNKHTFKSREDLADNCDMRSPDYDPYSENQCPTSNSGTDASSGTGSGSGVQYNEGDYTGGETVDWQTGVGNGGSSACGTQAKVEFVCIDSYNESTGQWEEYSCGYATSC